MKDFESGKRDADCATQTAMRVVLERAGIGFSFAIEDGGSDLRMWDNLFETVIKLTRNLIGQFEPVPVVVTRVCDLKSSGPAEHRTRNLGISIQTLYPVELRGRGGDGGKSNPRGRRCKWFPGSGFTVPAQRQAQTR